MIGKFMMVVISVWSGGVNYIGGTTAYDIYDTKAACEQNLIANAQYWGDSLTITSDGRDTLVSVGNGYTFCIEIKG